MNIANHRREDKSWKFMQVEVSRNTHLKAEGNLERETIQDAHKEQSCAQTETPIGKDKYQILTSKFRKGRSQRQISSFEPNPNRWKQRKMHQIHHGMTNGLQSGMRSKKCVQDISKQTSQGALQDERTLQGCLQYEFLQKLCLHKGEDYILKNGCT